MSNQRKMRLRVTRVEKLSVEVRALRDMLRLEKLRADLTERQLGHLTEALVKLGVLDAASAAEKLNPAPPRHCRKCALRGDPAVPTEPCEHQLAAQDQDPRPVAFR